MVIEYLDDEDATPQETTIEYLEDEPPARLFAAPEVEQPKVGTSISKELSQLGPAFIEAIGRPLENLGTSAEVIGLDTVGQALKGAITEPENYVSAAESFMEPQPGESSFLGFAWQYAPRAAVEQAGQVVGSIASRAAGAGAGLAVGGPVGAVAGAFVGPAIFEAAQIIGPIALERAQNNGREKPNNQDLVGGTLTALYSGALNAVGARYLPGGEKSTGKFFKRLALGFGGEFATETPQALGEQVGGTLLTEAGLKIEPKKAIGEGLIGGVTGAGTQAIVYPFVKNPENQVLTTPEEVAEVDIQAKSNDAAVELMSQPGDAKASELVTTLKEVESYLAANETLLQALEPNSPEAQSIKLENEAIRKEAARIRGAIESNAGLEPLSSTITEPEVVSEESAQISDITPAPTIGEKAETSPMIGAEPTQPAPAEGLPTDTSATILNYDERVKPIQGRIDSKIDELMADGMTFEEADNSPEVTALYEERFAMDRGAINSYRDIVNQAFADQGITQNDLTTTPARAIIEDVYAAPREGSEGLISVIAERGQQAFDNDAATVKKLAEAIFKYRAEAEGLSPEGLLGPQSALTKEGKKARVDEARVAAEAIHNQIKNALVTPAPETAAEPAVVPEREGPIGNRIKLGRSPQTYVVEEAIPQTEREVELGEQFFRVRNEKTGETQVVEQSDMKPVSRIRRGESGAMLIPTREDFVDLGQRIYEKGMQFKAWADRMIAEFGDAVREFLGSVWEAVSGIPAKINELAGYLPGKGEAGAVNIRGQQIGPAPESPEGQSFPEAMAKGIDIGPANNMPVDRKLISHSKNLNFYEKAFNFAAEKFSNLFFSASDRLRRGKFEKLGNAVDSYFDQVRERMRVADEYLLKPFQEFERSKDRKRIEGDVERYIAAQENNRETDPIRAEMHPIAIKIVDGWQKYGEVSGKDNQRLGIKVYEAEKGTWRPIGRLKRFFPRQIKPEYEKALRQPEKYPEEYSEIVEALLENGNIKTPEEAEAYLKRYRPDDYRDDYFSGIEMARGLALPEKLYDYSMSVMVNYIVRWANHASRIEAFGQKTTKESKTLWDREMETTRDPNTINYIDAVRARIEGHFPNDMYLRGAAALNIWATGFHLGNFASAALNLIGGSTLNAMIGQPGAGRSFIESVIELRNLGRNMQDAREAGVLTRDLMNIVGDHQAVMESNGFALAGGKVSDFLLKWGGFTPTEQMVRTQSFIIGKSFIRNTLRENLKNPKGSFARRSRAWLTRNGFDLDKLIVENGDGPETNRLLRYYSNISQGSYTIDQVPVYIDMPAGKFLFKYQKFSTQVMRAAWKNTFEPAWKAATGKDETVQLPNETRQILYRLKLAEAKELKDPRPISLDSIPKRVGKAEARALTFIPVIMWLTSAYVGGEALLRMRDILFGILMKGPGYEDMLKALEDDEKAAAFYLFLQRAWFNLIGIGALGFLGNYSQFALDWAERERVKNPLDPPALGVATEFGNLATTLFDQGKLTAGDISDFFTKQISGYRAAKKLAQSTAGWLGLDNLPGIKEEMFRREVANINQYARRWAKDAGIEYRKRRPGDVPVSERTPINRKIAGFLQSGEPEKAAVFAREYLDSLPEKDRKNAIQSLTTGARNRQPLRLGSGPMTDTERKAFLGWMKDKVSEEKYKKVLELDAKYQADYKTFLNRVPNR